MVLDPDFVDELEVSAPSSDPKPQPRQKSKKPKKPAQENGAEGKGDAETEEKKEQSTPPPEPEPAPSTPPAAATPEPLTPPARSRAGVLSKVKDDGVVIVDGLFDPAEDIAQFHGTTVCGPGGDPVGTILAAFGKAGKCKVKFDSGVAMLDVGQPLSMAI